MRPMNPDPLQDVGRVTLAYLANNSMTTRLYNSQPTARAVDAQVRDEPMSVVRPRSGPHGWLHWVLAALMYTIGCCKDPPLLSQVVSQPLSQVVAKTLQRSLG